MLPNAKLMTYVTAEIQLLAKVLEDVKAVLDAAGYVVSHKPCENTVIERDLYMKLYEDAKRELAASRDDVAKAAEYHKRAVDAEQAQEKQRIQLRDALDKLAAWEPVVKAAIEYQRTQSITSYLDLSDNVRKLPKEHKP